ncbi:MAG TPA: CBS domain-containing protein [Syntrophomonadaceae bacterium]|nr:CBS domain-containing protein [Syntrophomonadaceae bacterium]HQA07619.1 CBS domain-containing protein [Syntrophomonadaceae bacterium]HQE22996.1 CBS domain-containing protein [Syntrophomonadaceae bacterium]
MKMREIMSPNPFTLRPECSIQDAAKLFLDKGIDGAPVVDEDQHLLGLVTKMHLYRAIVDRQPLSLSVKDIMSTQIHALDENLPVEELHKLTFGRFPVLR